MEANTILSLRKYFFICLLLLVIAPEIAICAKIKLHYKLVLPCDASKIFADLQSNFESFAEVSLFSILGDKIQSIERHISTGLNSFEFARPASNGLFFIRVSSEFGIVTKQIVL